MRYIPSKTPKGKSVSDGVVICGGAAIQWVFRTQKCTTLSSSEAECVAITEGLKEAPLPW